MTEGLPPKDPQAKLPYGHNWADWLLREEATISSAEWALPDDSDLVIEDSYLIDGVSEEESPGTVVPNSVAIVWLSGGTAGAKYKPICHIVTTPDGKEDDRSLTIKVKDR